jgi:hypothetical protein
MPVTDFLLDFHEVLGGALVVSLLLPLVFLILFLVAVWRIGTGALQTAEANIRIAKALQDLKPAEEKLDAYLANAGHSKNLAAASQSQAEATAALAEQAKLAVQWYVHDLQRQDAAKTKK